MHTMCSREIFTKKCRQQQIFDSDLKGASHYNHVTFTPIAKNFMLYCRLIYILSILCVSWKVKNSTWTSGMKLIPLHPRSSVFSLVREVPILQFNLCKGTSKERFGNALGPWVWRRAFLNHRRLFRFYPRWRRLSIAISVSARPQASVKAVHEFLAYSRLTSILSFLLFCVKKNREAVNVLWTVPFLLVVSGLLKSFK